MTATLRYDIKAFEGTQQPKKISDFRFIRPEVFHFVLEDSQRKLIERYLGIYGDSTVGIGRILSKVYVRKLFRHAVMGSESLAGESEFRYRIAGLQN